MSFIKCGDGDKRIQCWNTSWEGKKGKKICGKRGKASVYIYSSCVARSDHKEWPKESSILGVDCNALQQQSPYFLQRASG
jgi:hypothetical protein